MANLFWSLSVEDRVKLMQYQWAEYGYKLAVPPEPKQEPQEIPVNTDMEEIELDRFMRLKPHLRRVK